MWLCIVQDCCVANCVIEKSEDLNVFSLQVNLPDIGAET